MKRLLLLVTLLCLAVPLAAQTPVAIIVTPSLVLAWDGDTVAPSLTAADAQTWTYTASVDTPPTLITLTGVTCVVVPPTAPAVASWTCQAPAAQLPLAGSHALTLTAGSAGVNGSTSLPSVPYAWVTIIIPVPTNVRLR